MANKILCESYVFKTTDNFFVQVNELVASCFKTTKEARKFERLCKKSKVDYLRKNLTFKTIKEKAAGSIMRYSEINKKDEKNECE